MVEKVGVLGCGAFGHAISLLLSKTHDFDVYANDAVEEVVDTLKEKGKHPYFHTEHSIPDNYVPTHDPKEVCDGEILILAVPGQVMRKAVESVKEHIGEDVILMNIAKALEKDTNKRMSEVIREVIDADNPIATLAGGMIASDVANGDPVGAEIACEDGDALKTLEEVFVPTTVHVDTTSDIAGVEFASSLKNVIAIGAGVIDGLGMHSSSKSFFITQAMREVEKLAVALGADSDTFHTSSNSWIGDMMTTCFGASRNRYFGELVGKGVGMEEAVKILEKEKKHAEGLATLEVIHGMMEEYNVENPFIKTLYESVYEGKDPHENFRKISLFQHIY